MALTEITYTNKETLNEQPSIADKNKVKAADMNEIKSVVNTNAGKVGDLANLDTTATSSIVASINELITRNSYSSNEILIGTWTDGKPLYRKVVNIEVGTRYQIDSTYKVVMYDIYFEGNDGRLMTGQWVQGTGLTVLASINASNKIDWQGDYSQWSGRPGYAIIEYTKTTD